MSTWRLCNMLKSIKALSSELGMSYQTSREFKMRQINYPKLELKARSYIFIMG